MRLEDLADVHAARHTQRVEDDIGMRPVLEERHVLDRQDAADDALVAVAAGHLVARLQLALYRDEHLDHLEHARRQLVAPLQLLDTIFQLAADQGLGVVILRLHRLEVGLDLVVLDRELRSEEHTSELQSLMRISYAVFCLKKKKKLKQKRLKPEEIEENKKYIKKKRKQRNNRRDT